MTTVARWISRVPMLLGAFCASLTGLSRAQGELPNEQLVCRSDEPRLDKFGYLRSLYLDLAGRVPTPDEYARLEGEEDVPEAMIDALLDSEHFIDRVVRAHRKLLWNNVENLALYNANVRLSVARPGELYWRRLVAARFRGRDVPCLNTPARFDESGAPIFEPQRDGTRREGFLVVSPYWAPTTQIKVCAADAQTADVSPSGIDCNSAAGFNDARCGCGENLRRCQFLSNVEVNQALAQDVDLRVAAILRRRLPYTELFTGRRAFVNGPLVFFFRHQVGFPAGITFEPLPLPKVALPDLDFTDVDNWVEVEAGREHAGVFTSPAYLLRFQTHRARAAHFFDAFLCTPLSPPPGGLPVSAEDALPSADLQRRDGCKYCHALLEPAAAYWGRWVERGAGFLDPARFPERREDCRRCAETGQGCSFECRTHYVTRALSSEEAPFLGELAAFQFLRPEHRRNVELGPKHLAATTILDDRFPSCSARRAMEGLFGRELAPEEEPALGDFGRAFVTSGFDYRALIKAIVTSSVYRRVR